MTNKNTTQDYSALFKPGQIGKLELKNRLIMAAMGNSLADNNGGVTDTMLDYYRARARGGTGLIISQLASVSQEDVMPYNLALFDDKYIPGLKRFADTVHEQGAKAGIQLMHPGMLFLLLKPIPQSVTIKVPSPNPRLPQDKSFKALSPEEIKKIVQDFAAAAVRAQESGADAIELHACHGCLLSTFLSPAVNRRTDEYGGNAENRARFVREVVEAIRQKLGAEFPLIVRINGRDDVEGGNTPDEVVKQAKILEAAGASAIHISSGLEYWSTLMAPSYLTPGGPIVAVAEQVKKAVKVPIIAAGKINPELAQEVIKAGRVDFVAWGRPVLADPELPNKLHEGKTENIVRCLYCNNCLRTSWRSCTVNPFLYRESTVFLAPASSPKKVLVAGGGLAGLQAAVLFKKRGHSVSLHEKNSELGGQWKTASTLPGKEGYATIIDYLKLTLEKLQVPVTLNSEITREKAAAIKPDMAIIATGAAPVGLEIPGGDRNQVIQASDLITGKAQAKGKAVVIGGRVLGMEAAILLAEQGKEVVLVSRSGLGGRKGPDDKITFRALMRRIAALRIPVYLNAAVLEITEKSVVLGLGEEIFAWPADTVVLAIGVKPVDKLASDLKGIVPEIYTIGDCMLPGNAAQATFSAMRLALKV